MKPFSPYAWLYAMLFLLLVLAVPHAGYTGDVGCWERWARYSFLYGLPNVYRFEDNNYPPFFHYILWVYGQVMGYPDKIIHYQHMVKIAPLLFDFAGALLVSRLRADASAERRFILSLLLLFNLGYLYNTLIWEQVDAIHTFFVAAALVLALRARAGASVLLFVLALNMKVQAIIFLPPLLLLWGPLWLRSGFGSALRAVVPGAVVQVALLLPFLAFADHPAGPRLYDVFFHAADLYSYLTMNAHNMWLLIGPEGPLALVSSYRDTTVGAAGLTYRQWGVVVFMATSAVALAPLLLLAVHKYRSQGAFSPTDQAVAFLSFAIVPLLFTYFNTQMHERYWHPAVLLVAGYAVLTRRYGLYVLLSVTYFLQLETVLKYMNFKNYKIAFLHPYFTAGLFTIILIWSLVALYRLAGVTSLLREIRLGSATPGAPPVVAV